MGRQAWVGNEASSPRLVAANLTRVIRRFAASEGVYEARRAAALAGVPVSTVYDWARKEVVVPGVSPVRQKLWSYADLMALRIVSWLRHPKEAPEGILPASPMPEVRRALARLANSGLTPGSRRAARRSGLTAPGGSTSFRRTAGSRPSRASPCSASGSTCSAPSR